MSKPMLRFEGFNDDWEEKTLGEIGEFLTSSINKKIIEGDPMVRMINYMDVYNQREIHNDTTHHLMPISASNTQIANNNLLKGDILFTPSSETAEDIGHSMVVPEDLNNTVYSYHLLRFRPHSLLDIGYSNYFCNIDPVRNQIIRFATGSTRFTIGLGNFSKVYVHIPSLPEQELIGNFFKTIDDLILAQEQAVKTYGLYKEAMLQKMFPKKGQVNPDLRFEGFNDDWEEKKLDKCFSKISEGGTPPTKNRSYYDDGEIPFIKIDDMSIREIVEGKDFISQLGLDKSSTWLVPKGSMLLSTGATIGRVSITQIPLATKQGIMGMVVDDNYNIHYLYSLFISREFQKMLGRIAVTGTFASVSKKELIELDLPTPSLEEQTLIGDFFKSLDEVIGGHQSKLDQYKEMKESFLQKMFI